MRYEKFKVIIGGKKEELNFYYTFFASNSLIKKGEIYQLSTMGSFVEDSSGIIQGIDKGGYEFEKVASSLLIKELWEEKEKGIEKSGLLEEDLKNKIKDVERINNELLRVKNELSSLKSRFGKLQTENEKNAKGLSETKESLTKKEDELRGISQDLVNSKEERTRLQGQVDRLQSEKNKIENQWINPERKEELEQEQEELQDKWRAERRKNQALIEELEQVKNRELSETIEKKLQEKKDELNHLKNVVNSRLENNKKNSLEGLLVAQEQLDSLIFESGVNQTHRIFSLTQDNLQKAKDKLIKKISSEEVESLCKMQTEISKLEIQQKQW
jgi:chromosome segregation ATPase